MSVAQSKHAVAIGHQVRSGNAFLAPCSSHLDEKPVLQTSGSRLDDYSERRQSGNVKCPVVKILYLARVR